MSKAIEVQQPAGSLPGMAFLKYFVTVDLSQFDFAAVLAKVSSASWDGINDAEAEECAQLLAKEFDETIDFAHVEDDSEAAAALWVSRVLIDGLRRGINLVIDRFGG